MAETADVVVIGGGVTGTSIAYHLAERGVDVVLCERGAIGDGITGTSGAIVRQHHSNPQLAAMAHYSLGVYRDFDERIGGPAGFVGTGYLVIVGPDEVGTLETNIAALSSSGIDVRRLDLKDLAAVLPYADLGGVAAASWEPDAGYADGRLTAQTFAARAADLGARVRTGEVVTAVRTSGGSVTGVSTGAGTIDAAHVVIAASTGAVGLMAPLGYTFPLAFEREWLCFFRRPWTAREPHPAGVDLLLRGHFRPDGGRTTLFGGESTPESTRVENPTVFERRASDLEVQTAQEALQQRFPAFGGAVALGGYACVDDVTPDWMPYLGRVPGLIGLVAAYGMSSHFFKHGPAVGRSIAELIVDGRSALIDLHAFRPERFDEGDPIRSPHPYGTAATL